MVIQHTDILDASISREDKTQIKLILGELYDVPEDYDTSLKLAVFNKSDLKDIVDEYVPQSEKIFDALKEFTNSSWAIEGDQLEEIEKASVSEDKSHKSITFDRESIATLYLETLTPEVIASLVLKALPHETDRARLLESLHSKI